MGLYHYQALEKSGNTAKGVIEAESIKEARRILREKALTPMDIYTSKKIGNIFNRKKMSLTDLVLFTRQFATLLAAGIPIEEALQSVAEQTDKNQVKKIIIDVRNKVMEGYTLAYAMKEYPEVFPELYRSTISAGEKTGQISSILENLAQYTESQQKIRQKIQQALIYPIAMLCISFSIVGFLLTFVVPKMIDAFTSSGNALPTMTVFLINISTYIKHYGLISIIFIALSVYALKYNLKKPLIKLKWDSYLLMLPGISYCIKTINVARYIHTFAMLFGSGVDVLESMGIAEKLIQNLKMAESFHEASIKVKEGISIAQALKQTNYIDSMTAHLIASGEKSGNLADMMKRSAQNLDNIITQLIDTALTLLEPCIILIMGAMVLFIVLATLLPIFSMEQLVN